MGKSTPLMVTDTVASFIVNKIFSIPYVSQSPFFHTPIILNPVDSDLYIPGWFLWGLAFAGALAILFFVAALTFSAQVKARTAKLAQKNRDLQMELAVRTQDRESLSESETRWRSLTENANRELALLNQIIAASVSGLPPEIILETTCRELSLMFDLSRSFATRFNAEKTTSTIIAEYRTEQLPSVVGQTWSLVDLPVAQQLIKYKTPVAIKDALTDPILAPIQDLVRKLVLVSPLLVPIIVENNVIGSLILDSFQPRLFSSEEIELTQRVADQIAGALGRIGLDQERRKLITAIEQVADSVIITDANGVVLYVNPIFSDITGYSQPEIVGKTPQMLKSGKHNEVFYKNLWNTITAGKVWHGRIENKKKDGSLYIEDATISPVYNETGDIVNYVGVKRDVTGQLRLEAQYHQAQKMEAIGRLAGGVAHDFNNLLTAIMGYTDFILSNQPAGYSFSQEIQDVQQIAERAAALTRQLLTFARHQTIELKKFNLNVLIINLEKMLSRLIGKDIELTTLPASNLGQIKADPGQIELVLVNLVVNARDAMPNGGKLTIKTNNLILNSKQATQYAGMKPGRYVSLVVEDTGTGMTEDVKNHAFEPFFTTKEVGKGTGLGLATCFGIVKQCHGHIWVDSESNAGTTITTLFPCVQKKSDPHNKTDGLLSLPQGTETILLVEDEPEVRKMGARLLRRQGYTVLEAEHGDAALALIEEYGEKEIHLLFTDIVMPQLGGQELVDQLKAMKPNLKILFTSGYTEIGTMTTGSRLNPNEGFIKKPYFPQTLTHKVRELLDESKSGK